MLSRFEDSLFLKNNFIYLFYFWLCWVFIAAQAFSLVAASGGYYLVAIFRLIVVASPVAEQRLWGA